MKRSSSIKITVRDYIIHGIFLTIYGFVKYLPSPVGDLLRYIVIKPSIRKIGKSRIYEGVTFWYPYRIKIGTNVTLNEWVYLSGFGGLEIHDNVRVGHRTTILTSDHIFSHNNIPIHKQGLTSGKVIIGKGAYIGCNVTILKGIKIGKDAVIGAGSVVTKDIPDNAIAVGVPAKIVKKR